MIIRSAARSGQTVTLNLQPGSLTVAFDEQTVLAYDRAGRLWSAFFRGYTFRRGLDGGVLSKWTARGRRERRRLARSEASLVVYRSSELMRSLAESAAFDAPPETYRDLQSVVERAAYFTPQAARIDAARYHRVYRPIGILPPDQYLALVLQLTEGCSFNTCTFCTFYRDRPFRIKSLDEFRAHVAAVCDYMGESLTFHRGVFLADANALVVPQHKLVPLIEALEEGLRQHAAGTKYASPLQLFAFLDGFSGRKKSVGDYAELASHGLKRIYIGLESGHDPLLAWLRKPGHAADAIEAVRAIKAGGVNVCVIVLLGAGGAKFAKGHVRDTIAAINVMSLGAGDLVYFSEFVALPGQPYGQIAQDQQVEPLSAEQMQAQRREIVEGLHFAGQPPKLATYDIREFVY
jgi:radical SAM superfamily enzyme YgiQ (UPF0313 family)